LAGELAVITEHSICGIEVTEWSLPLVAPFRVATRTAHEAHNVLIKVNSTSGLQGFGAAAPVEYITGETQDTVTKSLTTAARLLIGERVDHVGPIVNRLKELLPNEPSACAAAEMAVYDLWAKIWGIPLWQHFGGSQCELTTDITIPIVTPEEARELVREAKGAGFNLFKIKIGDSEGHDADLARIAATAESAPSCWLRIDANQAFTPDSAVNFVKAAQRISPHIQLVEQPVKKEDFLGLKYVKDHIDLPVFADESARSYEDVKRLLELEAVDGINIKLMKTGIRDSSDIAMLCRHSGIALMVGCMLESPLGIAAAASMSAGIGGFEFIDLDSHKLLKPVNCISGGFKTVGSKLIMNSRSPGWGIDLAE
jgi:L-alanine-DL-glutamate epimerase-like enolase superfamily enzyme